MRKAFMFCLALSLLLSASPANCLDQLYTGLIIDARELKVEPGMSPKVYDANGNEIYGTVNIDPDLVIEKGIVQYTRTIGEAIREELAGFNPIVVRAVGRGPHPYKADVTISNSDAMWILRSNLNSKFLEKLVVVFVI